MSKKDIFIYGAGGLGREILSLINNIGGWNPAGFIDDNVVPDTEINGIRVIGGSEALSSMKTGANVVLGIGDPVVKCEIIRSLSNSSIVFPQLIHPTAILMNKDSILLGEGTIISAGCVLTTDIRIGKHVLVNLNSTIGHDAHIGDYTSIMPGVNIAGDVIIGQSVMIGSGANIMNRMVISDKCRVGMGAVVTRPVPPNTTVVGIPAKPLIR